MKPEERALGNMIMQLEKLHDSRQILDEQWKANTKAIERLEQEDIPMLLKQIGVERIDTETHIIKIGADWRASIPKAARADVCAYIKQLGIGDLIQHSLVQDFSASEQEQYKTARAELRRARLKFSESVNINTASLKKAVKELIAQGEVVDLNRVHITRIDKANVKRKKGK